MVRIYWQNSSKTALMWTFSGNWTSDEFYVALSEYRSLLLDTDNSTTVIIDLRKGFGPDNLLVLAREGFCTPTDKIDQIIIVGYIPTWKSLFSILMYTLKGFVTPVTFVETLSEGENLVKVE